MRAETRRRTLAELEPNSLVEGRARIHVCENPRVVEAAADAGCEHALPWGRRSHAVAAERCDVPSLAGLSSTAGRG
ncbi:DUF2399 domain-containing protein [Streptomyces canus]|uniref:DUF2399 domain-containing protein n=1 Tax=Streptomyces canus TaxID=58343 RepID=UPI0033BB0A85